MPEEKITINIDEDGTMELKTEGFFGETCISALEEILNKEDIFLSDKKTDDFYKKINLNVKNKIQQGK